MFALINDLSVRVVPRHLPESSTEQCRCGLEPQNARSSFVNAADVSPPTAAINNGCLTSIEVGRRFSFFRKLMILLV